MEHFNGQVQHSEVCSVRQAACAPVQTLHTYRHWTLHALSLRLLVHNTSTLSFWDCASETNLGRKLCKVASKVDGGLCPMFERR